MLLKLCVQLIRDFLFKNNCIPEQNYRTKCVQIAYLIAALAFQISKFRVVVGSSIHSNILYWKHTHRKN